MGSLGWHGHSGDAQAGVLQSVAECCLWGGERLIMIFWPRPHKCIIIPRTEFQSLGKSVLVRGECLMANGNSLGPENKPIQKKQSKKTYTKPAFRFERVFETQALSCGKVHPFASGCHSNRKNS